MTYRYRPAMYSSGGKVKLRSWAHWFWVARRGPFDKPVTRPFDARSYDVDALFDNTMRRYSRTMTRLA